MIKIIPKTIKSNRRSCKRSVTAALLLAITGFFALSGNDINTRRSLANTKGSMKFQFAEETLRQAQEFQKYGQQLESTIATVFFQLENSKHDVEEYLDWAQNSLCITDAMVIFTNVPEKLAPLREHAKDRTIIVPMEIEDVQVGNDIHLTDEQWNNQTRDGKYSKNINLYKVWAGKSWLVNQAVQLNPFRSEVYHWMDIGHFRDGQDFCGETVVRHPEVVPEDQMMMFMRRDLQNFDDPEAVVVQKRFAFTFIPGGWIAGRAHVWPKFLERFEETIAMYLLVGESSLRIKLCYKLHVCVMKDYLP